METPIFKMTIVGELNKPTTLSDLVDIFLKLIQAALPVIAALALLAFLWGLTRFIFRLGGDEKAVTEGKNLMKWGLIALFLLLSFWSIIRLIYGDLGFGVFVGLPFLPQ